MTASSPFCKENDEVCGAGLAKTRERGDRERRITKVFIVVVSAIRLSTARYQIVSLKKREARCLAS